MLDVDLDENEGIAIFRPEGSLDQADFDYAANLVDQYLEKHEALRGLIISTRDFGGWDSFSALVRHLRFVRNHHRQIGRVALATDSAVGQLGEKLADHFVAAEIRSFPFDDMVEARRWVLEAPVK
ncbi:STAS/SEC14 domain-containing protein [Marinobacter salicampi]|uniref:STAS/SEC14 domain-containing protein n=1 Tax=Marinobacter salicampi TaxID=435907 RepID=UPI00140C9F01|nr:STAS/SEC14 domain-containing protein [Marinobacter salicampi]